MPRLPIVHVSEDGLELLKSFAQDKELEFSTAMRLLLNESPSLHRFAKSKNLAVDLDVKRGGRRIPKDVQAELDSLRKKS